MDNFIRAVLYYDTPLNEKYLKSIDKRFLNMISDNYLHIYRFYVAKFEKNCDSEEELFSYKLYLRLLLVTDYICGMTDTYAKTLYQELTGIV